jgi:hypothetical protein
MTYKTEAAQHSINYLVAHLALDSFYGEFTREGLLAATLASAHLYEFLV